MVSRPLQIRKMGLFLAARAQKGHSRLNYAAVPWARRQMESTES
jgi:hypothetical protein